MPGKQPEQQGDRRDFNEGKTEFLPSGNNPSVTDGKNIVKIDMGGPSAPQDEKTVGIFRTEKGCDPVVGWLVCVEGGEKGRDYRLHAGRNFIGRGLKSDVALPDDEQISREDHCSIVFEPKGNAFAIVRGGGEMLVNGSSIATSQKLNGGEKIVIGASTFVFTPFCKEDMTW